MLLLSDKDTTVPNGKTPPGISTLDPLPTTSRIESFMLAVTLEVEEATTRTLAVSRAPPSETRIRAVPMATPRTNPPEDTLASWGSSDATTGAGPLMTRPRESRAIMLREAESPITSVKERGITESDCVVGTRTCTFVIPTTPSTAAVITVGPREMAVTTPVAVTIALVGSLLDHETARSVSCAPNESRDVAESSTI